MSLISFIGVLSLIRSAMQNIWISCTETGILFAITTVFRYIFDLKKLSLELLLVFFIKTLITIKVFENYRNGSGHLGPRRERENKQGAQLNWTDWPFWIRGG